jgi:hypothetical protein
MAFAITDTDLYTVVIYYDVDGDEEYFCYADPGNYNRLDASIWRIKKFIYGTVVGEKKLIAITWANGNKRLNLIANERANYSYS